jgi:YVTN family beta-propeller protein
MLGDGQLSFNLRDVLICNTGPQGTPELYVSDECNNRVSVLDMATGAVKRHIDGLSQPQGIALSLGGVDSQGGDHLLYVCEEDEEEIEGRIHILNARTGAHVGYLGEGELSRPEGIRLHAATENRTLLFVTDIGNNKIRIYEV